MDTNLDFDIIQDEDILADIPAVETSPNTNTDFSLEDITFDIDKPTEIKPKENVQETSEEISEENHTTEENTEDASIFQEYADNLVEMGIFFPEETEEKVVVKSAEEFADRFKNSYQKGAVNYIDNIVGQYGPEYAEAFDAIYVKGIAPSEYFARQEEIENYENLDLTSEEDQKKVYRDYMNKAGFTKDKVEAKLQKLIDGGELEDEAKDYHEKLVESERKALQTRTEQAAFEKQQAAQRITEYQNLTVSTINEKLKDKSFDGIPLSPKKAQETINYLLAPKYVLTTTGQKISEMDKFLYELNNPENLALKIKVALLAQEGFKTEAIAKEAVSKQANKLFQSLSHKEKTKERTEPKQQSFFL